MFVKFLVISTSYLFFCNAAIGQPSEVHAIGVYKGDVRTDGTVHGPEARVTVDRQDDDVILVLGSYRAVRWIVETSTNTSIDMIYVHGYTAERSEVLLNGVPFSAEVLNIGYTHRDEGSRFRNLVKVLSVEFDVPGIASFQGAYTAPDAPFVIDSVQKAAINQVGYLLPQIQTEALTDDLRQFLEEGAKPIARLTKEGFYLLKDGEEVHFPITLDVPNVSWPGLATYDPISQRLYAGTAWTVGFFYIYDILNNRWSAFEQPMGMEIQGVVYDVDQNRLVLGINSRSSGRNKNAIRLIEMSTSGEMSEISHDVLVGLTDLEDVGNGPAATLVPLAIDGDLLLALGQGRFPHKQPQRTYLINLETGQVTLVGLQD